MTYYPYRSIYFLVNIQNVNKNFVENLPHYPKIEYPGQLKEKGSDNACHLLNRTRSVQFIRPCSVQVQTGVVLHQTTSMDRLSRT